MARPHEVHNGVRRPGLHVFLKRRDVGSRAECPSGAGDDDDANRRIEFDAVQLAHQAGDKLIAQRIELIGPVQRQDRDGAAILPQQMYSKATVLGHGAAMHPS